MKYDVVVIGGGHNGLTTAAYLAKAGRKVLLLEQRDRLGGLAALEEFHPGYKTPGLLHDTSGLRSWVVEELDLQRYGLIWLPAPPPVFAPQQAGQGLLLFHDPIEADAELKAFSARDTQRYRDYRAFIERIRGFINEVMNERPPDIMADGLGELWRLLRTGVNLRRLGDRDMVELVRIAPMCLADWLNEWFETGLLKALLAGPALTGMFTGPWSAGTTATLLLHECTAGPGVKGGPAALVSALAAAAGDYGVEVRTEAPVKRIQVSDGRVTGVTLTDGETIETAVVVSSCEPKRTLLDMVAPVDLPLRMEEQIRVYRTRGTTAKVNLALKALPEFTGRPGQQFEVVRIGDGLNDLERAFDAVKYGRFSASPQLDIRFPSLADPPLAPPGHHVASVLVQCAPYNLEGGWTEAQREALADTVMATLDHYAPCTSESTIACQVLAPVDLEGRYGLTGGHVFHGEHGLDQLLFMRPALSCSRYATPITGLFLCGSGSHPGGGITCAPGALAARTILKG